MMKLMMHWTVGPKIKGQRMMKTIKDWKMIRTMGRRKENPVII